MNTLTVILPTYNRLNLLKKAYESCKSQSNQNFDLIIIDNCSTDGTKAYLGSIGDDCRKKTIIVNESNIGSTRSIQKAIEIASTKWITILCDDDYFENNFIEVFTEIASHSTKGLIISGFNNVDSNIGILSQVKHTQASLSVNQALTKIFDTAEITIAGISGFIFQRCKFDKVIKIKDYPKGFLSDTMIVAESLISGSGAEVIEDVLYNRLVWSGGESAFSLPNIKMYNEALLLFHVDMSTLVAQSDLNPKVKRTLAECQPLVHFIRITCLPIIRHGDLSLADIRDFKSIFSKNNNYRIHYFTLQLAFLVCRIFPLSFRKWAQRIGKQYKSRIKRFKNSVRSLA